MFQLPISLSLTKRIPSRAGKKTVFDTAANLVSFVPLSTISPEARALQDEYLATIRAGIDSGSFPPGLRKQYALQLEHIEAQIPSCEVILVPVYSFENCKHKTRLLLLTPV